MAAASRGLPVHRNQYHRKLPTWIVESDDYDDILSKYRVAPRILQVAANRGDEEHLDGCAFRFLVGVKFMSWIPCVNSTLWRSIDILEQRGFLVCLSRGGSVYVSKVHENWASSFGIPIQKGSLEHRRVRRCKFHIIEDDSGTKHRKMIRKGDQITFYDRYKSFRESARKPPSKPADPVRSSNYPSSIVEHHVVRS